MAGGRSFHPWPLFPGGDHGILDSVNDTVREEEAVNIQIFGTSKCFDTRKAQRYFKERRIKFQSVDVGRFGMSRGELASVKNAVGLEALVNPKHPDAVLLSYLAGDQAKLERIFEDPTLLRTPVVRNGKQATVGYCPEIWAQWK